MILIGESCSKCGGHVLDNGTSCSRCNTPYSERQLAKGRSHHEAKIAAVERAMASGDTQPERELAYSIDIGVNRVLSETEKNKLMLALSKAVAEILGTPKSGTVVIHSEK